MSKNLEINQAATIWITIVSEEKNGDRNLSEGHQLGELFLVPRKLKARQCTSKITHTRSVSNSFVQ